MIWMNSESEIHKTTRKSTNLKNQKFKHPVPVPVKVSNILRDRGCVISYNSFSEDGGGKNENIA
jgi:hypothetical protein